MELNDLNTPFNLHLRAEFGFNEDGTRTSQFTWGIMDNPMVVRNDDDALLLLHLKREQGNATVRMQMMRLFACNIVRDLLIGAGTTDANHTPNEVKLELPQEIKEYTSKVVDALSKEIINEIIYQIDPIKPTKSKLDSLSLIPKQEQTNQNTENGQEGT
jgi:hypothetical protein